MTKPQRSSERRLFAASALILVGRIGLIVVVAHALLGLLLQQQAMSLRGVVMLVVVVLLLAVAAVLLRDRDLLPQIGLQAVAVVGLLSGVVLLVRLVFRDWRLLGTRSGLISCLLLGIGAGASYALHRYQRWRKFRRTI